MTDHSAVTIWASGVPLDAELAVPSGPRGVVLFVHGSGGSRHSARDRLVASRLRAAGYASLLVDLLTAHEERIGDHTIRLRLDVDLLGSRLVDVVDWLPAVPAVAQLPVGVFGAGTGAAAALLAAAARPTIQAVVARGGRPDLAGAVLGRVRTPALFLVGRADERLLDINEQAAQAIGGPCRVDVVAGTGHLLSDRHALESVAHAATDWYDEHVHAPVGHPRHAGLAPWSTSTSSPREP